MGELCELCALLLLGDSGPLELLGTCVADELDDKLGEGSTLDSELESAACDDDCQLEEDITEDDGDVEEEEAHFSDDDEKEDDDEEGVLFVTWMVKSASTGAAQSTGCAPSQLSPCVAAVAQHTMIISPFSAASNSS